MSQTLTISAPLVMSAVPALLLGGGLIVGWFLRGDLATNIEVARLNADNDARTARWLWQRGYRSTPHAGPDVTEDLPAIETEPHVDGEVLHVEHPTGEIVRPTLADLAEEVALVQASACCTGHGDEPCAQDSGLIPPYCCGECPNRGSVLALSDEPEHDDEDAPAEDTDRPGLWLVLLAIPVALWDRLRGWLRSLRSKPDPYRGRHWVEGTVHTGTWPIVRRSGGLVTRTPDLENQHACVIPEQRTGGDDRD